MGRARLTDYDRTEDDEGDDDLQGGCQELFLVLGWVVWNLQLGEGKGRDEYRSDTHLEDQLVNT
jgi:hypothetical protein